MEHQSHFNFQLRILTPLVLFILLSTLIACGNQTAKIKKNQNSSANNKGTLIKEPSMPKLVNCGIGEPNCRIHYFDGRSLVEILDNTDKISDQTNIGLILEDAQLDTYIGVFFTAGGYEPQMDVINITNPIDAKILQHIAEPRVGYVIGVLVQKPAKIPGKIGRNGMNLLANKSLSVIRGGVQHSIPTDQLGRFQLSVPPGRYQLKAGTYLKEINVVLGETMVLPMQYKD